MRTIAFYSYKGGVGKSLTAANLAICLSRLGRNCALMDFDVDAPSLHSKMRVGEPVLGRGGLVDIIESSVHFSGNDNWSNAKLSDVQFHVGVSLKQFGTLLDDLKARDADRGADNGHVWFFPAGNIHMSHYWEIVWSGLWRDIFTTKDRAVDGQADQEEVDKVFDFLANIKHQIAALSPQPEYLIVDCRSGASNLTSTLLSAWLKDPTTDHLVYVFGFNDESVSYLEYAIGQFAEEAGARLTPVLSRVPTNLEFRGDRKLFWALDRLGVSFDDLLVLHSDRELEGYEQLRLGQHVNPSRGRLTMEYLALFEKLISKDHWRGNMSLADAMGFNGDLLEEQDRLFKLEVHSGAMINPNDGSRNVAFKVETFQMLMEGLSQGIEGTSEVHTERLEALLTSAGLHCGHRFGEVLAPQFRNASRIGPQEKLTRWCDFDSDVGFGRFELDIDSLSIRGKWLLECSVILHQSFLAPADDVRSTPGHHDHKYCFFMIGYLKGVLGELLNVSADDLTVTHEVLRRQSKERSDSCVFHVKCR